MDRNPENIWKKTLDKIREELPPPVVESVLCYARLSLNSSIATLRFPSEYLLDLLSHQVKCIVAETLEEEIGEKIELRLSVDKSIAVETKEDNDSDFLGDGLLKAGYRIEDEVKPRSAKQISDPMQGKLFDPYADPLRPGYTFESFVRSPHSDLSYAAAMAVSQDPGKAYNPLFIYAASGLGKTHLMHAIGHRAREQHKGLRLCYVTAEDFTYELIDSIQHPERMPAFRNKYRGVDLLLIDDIQFLIKKTQTQEAFFHTFNALHEKGRQIVITADRPPRDLQTMEERLTSRFAWGLTTDIQPPDFETRLAIIRKKCEENNYRLYDDILQFVAENVATNVRDLEGCLKKVSAYSQFSVQPLTLEDAKRLLGDLIKRAPGQGPEVNEIIKAVCRMFAVSEDDLVGKSRKACYVMPRQTAIWLIKELTPLTLMEIAERIGGRDHSTILHSIQRCQYRQVEDKNFKATVNRLKVKLTGIDSNGIS